MRFIDISWPITDSITQFSNGNNIQIKTVKHFLGDGFHETEVNLGLHTGTHIDAQKHFLEHGEAIDLVPLKKLNGICRVVDLTVITEKISRQELEPLSVTEGEIILFKTKNSRLSPEAPFEPAFVYLDSTAAAFLAEKKIKAVGIDYLSLERNQEGFPTHKILLQQNIPIIEGLRLQHIPPGKYQLLCLPLHFKNVEAAPARAVLCMD